jgi:hypothetical protein
MPAAQSRCIEYPFQEGEFPKGAPKAMRSQYWRGGGGACNTDGCPLTAFRQNYCKRCRRDHGRVIPRMLSRQEPTILYTDDADTIPRGLLIVFPELVGCLAFVTQSPNGTFKARHIAGMDLQRINPEMWRMRLQMFGANDPENEGTEYRIGALLSDTQEAGPDNTYVCGPNADDMVADYFGVTKLQRTVRGPVTATFNTIEMTWSVEGPNVEDV